MNARALLSRSYLAAAVAAALFLPARPADAAIAGAFVGSGNINPGSMATASFQQIHIAGQLNFVSTGAPCRLAATLMFTPTSTGTVITSAAWAGLMACA